jgi:hypothetical protein
VKRKVKTYRKQRRMLTDRQWVRSITYAQHLRVFGWAALFAHTGRWI